MTESFDFKHLNKWHQRFLGLACNIASWSKDKTKVGCVLVKERRILATGFNGFPPGVEDSGERYANTELKRLLVQHAEANAVSFAAKFGVDINGATAYVTHPCCSQCAGKLVCAGVREIIHWDVDMNTAWGASIEAGKLICLEAGIIRKPVKPYKNCFTSKRIASKSCLNDAELETSVEVSLREFFKD